MTSTFDDPVLIAKTAAIFRRGYERYLAAKTQQEQAEQEKKEGLA